MATINGKNYSEDIFGTNSRDVIFGNGGDDYIRAYGGNDDIFGGTGDDIIAAGAGNDDLQGGSGVNDLWGGSGYDWFIMAGRGNRFSDDWIADFQFDVDSIDVSAWGVSDFNQLRALLRTDSAGSAWLNAYYDGYDHYLTIDGVSAGELIASDFVYSDSGARRETGTAYDDTMFGSRSSDELSGANGDDTLLGGIGTDVLQGDAGSDRLIGGAGQDMLAGGAGRDVLTGDGAADVFDFNFTSDSRDGSSRDRITDFRPGTDVIDLSDIDARNDIGGNQDFTWRGADGFTAPGQLRYSYSGNDTIISASVDGDGNAEFQIQISGRFIPVAGDFIL